MKNYTYLNCTPDYSKIQNMISSLNTMLENLLNFDTQLAGLQPYIDIINSVIDAVNKTIETLNKALCLANQFLCLLNAFLNFKDTILGPMLNQVKNLVKGIVANINAVKNMITGELSKVNNVIKTLVYKQAQFKLLAKSYDAKVAAGVTDTDWDTDFTNTVLTALGNKPIISSITDKLKSAADKYVSDIIDMFKNTLSKENATNCPLVDLSGLEIPTLNLNLTISTNIGSLSNIELKVQC